MMTFIGILGICVVWWLVKELDLMGYVKDKIHNGTKSGKD